MSKKIKILLMEEDKNVCSHIVTTLKNEGYSVVCAATGTEGISLAASICPEVILLDMEMPDMDGCEIIRNLRTWGRMPIIVISSERGEKEKVEALDLGADDYMTKPFGNAELMARIRTSLRRGHGVYPFNIYKADMLKINFENRTVQLEDRYIHLTQIEYRLLSLLAQNSGKVLTYNFIMSSIWGPYIDNNNQILRVNMANIRRKIGENPASPRYIFTEVGIGYRMRDNEGDIKQYR
jgi:two-component system KDP operon response regulator KdpE